MKSDKQIQDDVMAELDWEPSVSAAHIGVEVSEGVVTLAGHVSSVNDWLERQLANDSAWSTPGVRNVHDNMTVAF